MENNLESVRQKEIEKLQSEIDKNIAEKAKFDAEAGKIKKENSRLFLFAKWVSAGVVVAGLLAAWIIGYFWPISETSSKLATLEISIQQAENKITKKQLDSISQDLQRQKLALVFEKARATALLTQLDSISHKYKRLLEENPCEGADIKYKLLGDEVEKLIRDIASSPRRIYGDTSTSYADQLLRNWLKSHKWRIEITNEEYELKHNFIWSFLANGKVLQNGEPTEYIWKINYGWLSVDSPDESVQHHVILYGRKTNYTGSASNHILMQFDMKMSIAN